METLNTKTIETILELVAKNTKIGSQQSLKLAKDLTGLLGNSELFTNNIILTRSLLGMGLNVQEVATLLSTQTNRVDSQVINSNNLVRKGLGDTSAWSATKLRQSPKYNKKLSPEEFETLKTMHPNASLFKNRIMLEPTLDNTTQETEVLVMPVVEKKVNKKVANKPATLKTKTSKKLALSTVSEN